MKNRRKRKNNHIVAMEELNTGRQIEIDSIKMVFVFIVAAIHCTIECTSDAGLQSGLAYVFDTVIGGPLAAPPLMFVMGVCLVYAKKRDWKTTFFRGLGLFGMGFVLNICRYTIPYLIGYAITGDAAKYIDPIWYRTFCNDIFQFAGLALCVIAWMIRLQIPDLWMFLLALACSVLGTALNGTDVGSPAGNIVLGYLIGTEDAAGKVFSDFVLLNWLIVPVSGYLFGKRLRRVRDKAAFYRRISPVCALIATVYFVVGIRNSSGMFGDGENCYYHIITPDALACIVTALALLGIHYAINSRLPQTWQNVVGHIGGMMTLVYCLHWVILVYTVNLGIYIVRGTQELPMYQVLVISAAVTALSILVAELWTRKLKEKVQKLRRWF